MLETINMVLQWILIVAAPTLYWSGIATFEAAAFGLILNIAFDCHLMRFNRE